MNNIDNLINLEDREDAYMRLVDLYLNTTEHIRSMIRINWDFNTKWIYQNPFKLACSVGERYTPRQKIISSLIYDAIEDAETTREHIIGNAIDYHSCILSDINPVELFTLAAKASTQRVSMRFIEFINRKEKDRSLNAFNLRPIKNANCEWEIHIDFKYAD